MKISRKGYFFAQLNALLFYIRYYVTLLFFGILYSIKGIGQYAVTGRPASLDPIVLNSNGGNVLLNSILLEWNVGELAQTYSIQSRPFFFLTTGYLQNGYDITLLFSKLSKFGEQIKIGPNPFHQLIHIYCAQEGLNINSIHIIDSKGVHIKSLAGPFSGLNFDKTIAIEKHSDPLYFIQINYTVANAISLTTIYKLIQY